MGRIKSGLSCLLCMVMMFANAQSDETVSQGRALAFARDKGNCLACHVIAGGTQMGDVGPPLTTIKNRFPDASRLHAQIWDAGQFNPQTLMPPYGRHEILSDDEIRKIVTFLYSQ